MIILFQNAYPSPLNYHGFLSQFVILNEVICLGIPSKRCFKRWYILNIDVTLPDTHGDTNKTFLVSNVSEVSL